MWRSDSAGTAMSCSRGHRRGGDVIDRSQPSPVSGEMRCHAVDSSDGHFSWGAESGYQDRRGPCGVVERSLEGREDRGEHVPQLVDSTDPILYQVAAVAGQPSKFGHQFIGSDQRLQVRVHASGLGDHAGVLGDFAFTAEDAGHCSHHSTANIDHLVWIGIEGDRRPALAARGRRPGAVGRCAVALPGRPIGPRAVVHLSWR